MTLLRLVLGLVHVGVAAAWLGAMAYSLAVVQPTAARFFPTRSSFEDFAVSMAAGARPKVLAMIGTLAGSGVGVTVVELVDTDDPSGAWLAVVFVKAVVLVAATATFALVSWRLWPARLFAPVAELAVVQARFRRVALGLTALVASGLALGVVADVLGPT